MNRKYVFPVLLLCLAVACASVAPGADPLVVNAERSINIAFETVDTFLFVEKTHQADLAKVSPGIHAVAERIRGEGPEAFRKARRLIDVYKGARTDENKANFMTAIAFVQALANEVSPYLAKYEAAKAGGN